MRDLSLGNVGNETESVAEFFAESAVAETFDTQRWRVAATAWGVVTGRGTEVYDSYSLLERVDNQTLVHYRPDVQSSVVLLLQASWGYDCRQSPQDMNQIHKWFESELSEHATEEGGLNTQPSIEIEQQQATLQAT
jgi:hypothetical protein